MHLLRGTLYPLGNHPDSQKIQAVSAADSQMKVKGD